MRLYDSGSHLAKNDFKKIEKELDLSLPSDYKEFMLQVNGGTPEEDLIFRFTDVVTKKVNNSDLRELFVFYFDEEKNEDSFDDILRIYNSMVAEQLIPPFFLPIGDDSGGNPICINLSNDDYGAILFCDHELENTDTGFLAASKIADDFTEFLKGLYPLSLED